MYVSVRRYTMGAGSTDALAHRLEEEFAPAISQEPGFLGYLAIETDEGTLETVSVFADARSAHRSDELAADYVAENLTEFELTRTSVTGGDVLASRITPAMLDAAHRWRTQRARARGASQACARAGRRCDGADGTADRRPPARAAHTGSRARPRCGAGPRGPAARSPGNSWVTCVGLRRSPRPWRASPP